MKLEEEIVDPVKFDFEQARSKHLLFKSRLRSLLYGADIAEAPVISHYECTVGKWIYGHALTDYAYIPEMHQLEKVHADLHTLARHLVEIYKEGRIDEARRRLEDIENIAERLIALLSMVEAQVQVKPSIESWNKTKQFPSEINMEELYELQSLNNDLDKRIREQSKELLQLKERFELVSKATQDAVWDWDLHINKVWWNEGFKALFHFKTEEIEPGIESWNNRLHPEDKERVLTNIQQAIDARQNQWSAEYRFLKGDGSYAYVFDRGYTLYDEEGSPYRMIGSISDITRQKQAQYALIESENNLRKIVLQAPVAMCILRGPSFTVEIANERMFELWGVESEQVMNKPIFIGLPQAREQGLEELLENVFTTGDTFSAKERPLILHRNGQLETIYLNFVYETIKEGDGTISGILAVAIDVSDQVIARKKIEEKNEEMQFVMDFMPQLVWNTSPDGKADFFNQVYLDYSGLPLEELKGTGWVELIHPDDLHSSNFIWQQALEGGGRYVVEHRLRSREGKYRWFLTRGVPLRDETGQIVKWYGTSTDIQEQKMAAEVLKRSVEEHTKELRQANKTLKKVNRELEEFTFVSHHDLQEPLRKIILFSDLVKTDITHQLSDPSRKRLEKVTNAARRMSTALKDVLNFASLNKEDQFTEVDLNETVRAVQIDLEHVISEKNATLQLDKLAIVKAIPQQMHQLFYNLINNALKFSKKEVASEINITCKRVDASETELQSDIHIYKQYYKIACSDNGIGFDQKNADKIFTMFQRLHSKDEYIGTGMGLALVRKVILNHNGRIWAESEPGKGATFFMLLPVE